MPDIFDEELAKVRTTTSVDIFDEELKKGHKVHAESAAERLIGPVQPTGMDVDDVRRAIFGEQAVMGAYAEQAERRAQEGGFEQFDAAASRSELEAQQASEARKRERVALERRSPVEKAVTNIAAGLVEIADAPTFGARPFGRLAAAVAGEDGERKVAEAQERAYDPARQAYGETATKIVRGATTGAASMTTLAPVAGAATKAVGKGLDALGKAGKVAGVAAAPISFAAIEAGSAALQGEDVLKAGLHGLGFGALAGLGGKALREGLDLLPITQRRALAERIIALMERGKTVPDRALSSLAHRTAYANGIAEAGAMAGAGAVVSPGGWDDAAVNAFLGGVLGVHGRQASRGFQKADALAPYAPKVELVEGRPLPQETYLRDLPAERALEGEAVRRREEKATRRVADQVDAQRQAESLERGGFRVTGSKYEAEVAAEAERVVGGVTARKEALNKPPEPPKWKQPPEVFAEDVDLLRRKPLTQAEAGEVKARAVAEGKATPEEVASPERLEALRKGGVEGLASAPPIRRADGSVAAGYDPQAKAKGLIDPRAIPAVEKAEAQGVQVVSSHFKNGNGVAIGKAPNGEVVRVEAPPVYQGASDALASQRGFVGLHKTAPGFGGSLLKGAAKFATREVGSAPERLRSYKTPAAREAADKAQTAMDRAKAHYGAQSAEVDAVLLHGRRAPKVVEGLAKHDFQPGQRFANSPIREMVEGRASPRTPEEAKAVTDLRALLMRSGRVLESVGLEREGRKGPEKYVARPDTYPQIMHADGLDLMRAGPSAKEAWDALVDGTATLSNGGKGIPREKADAYLRKRWEEMSDATGKATEIAVAAEHAREGIVLPSAIKTSGGVAPILETNLVTYAKRLAHSNASRAGVIEAFGQGKVVDDLRKRVREETGTDKPLVETMRELHGVPVEPPKVEPGTPAATIARGAGSAGGALKELMLTATTPTQALEVLGNNATFGGLKTWLEATSRQLRFGSKTRAEGLAEAEGKGQIDRSILNRTIDSGRPVTTSVRVGREYAGRATGRIPVEQATGTNAAFVAQAVRNRMVARKGQGESISGQVDVGQMMRLGFDKATATRMAYGNGTPAEYDAMLTRAPSRLIGENLLAGEQGRLEHRRITKGVTFQRFAHMNARDTVRVLKSAATLYEHAVKAKSWRSAVAASRNILAHAAGKAVSNATATLATTYLLYGKTGFDIAWEEAKGDIIGFLGKSALAGAVSGPYSAVLRATGGDENALRNLYLPVSMFFEVKDMVGGDGRYRYAESSAEKAAEMFERYTPLHRAFTTGVFAWALGNDTEARKIEVAKRGYWRWYRSTFGDVDRGGEREAAESTKKMRKAYEAVLAGDVKKADGIVKEAIAAGSKKPGASLRGRLLLDDKGVKAKLSEIRDKEWFPLVEAHDRLIRAYAASR